MCVCVPSGGAGRGRRRELPHSHPQARGSAAPSVSLRGQEQQAGPAGVAAVPPPLLLRGQLPPDRHAHHRQAVSPPCVFAYRRPTVLTCSEAISRNIPSPFWSRSKARPAETDPPLLMWKGVRRESGVLYNPAHEYQLGGGQDYGLRWSISIWSCNLTDEDKSCAAS